MTPRPPTWEPLRSVELSLAGSDPPIPQTLHLHASSQYTQPLPLPCPELHHHHRANIDPALVLTSHCLQQERKRTRHRSFQQKTPASDHFSCLSNPPTTYARRAAGSSSCHSRRIAVLNCVRGSRHGATEPVSTFTSVHGARNDVHGMNTMARHVLFWTALWRLRLKIGALTDIFLTVYTDPTSSSTQALRRDLQPTDPKSPSLHKSTTQLATQTWEASTV